MDWGDKVLKRAWGVEKRGFERARDRYGPQKKG